VLVFFKAIAVPRMPARMSAEYLFFRGQIASRIARALPRTACIASKLVR
jgi:hypothetical protein